MNKPTVSHGTVPVDLCQNYGNKNLAVVAVTVLLVSNPGE